MRYSILIILSIIFCINGQIPQAPVLKKIHQDAVLNFGTGVEVGTTTNLSAQEPDSWFVASNYELNNLGFIKVFARFIGETENFEAIYEVVEEYPSLPEALGTSAVSMNDTQILSWASGVESVNYGENVTSQWQTPELALGAAAGNSFDIVSLGEGGEITLSFSNAIVNGDDYDFCVFENSFNDVFLEIAKVAVSSDGETFCYFDCAYLGVSSIGANGGHSTSLIGSFAGKYMQGYGTAFDLEVLKNKQEVISGTVDLNNILYVKIDDVVGDGSQTDSFGNVIYDPYPTSGSAGFDLDAIGVINASTSITEEEISIPVFEVTTYPNPFNSSTTISFDVPDGKIGKLSIYDSKGSLIKQIENLQGNRKILLDMSDYAGGVYFYRFEVLGYSHSSGKLLFLK